MDSGIGLGNEKKVRKMKVKLRFSDEVTSTDPVKRNVMIIGQLPHLNAVPWDSVSNKLKPRVEEQLYARALKTLGTNNGSSSVCSLFFNSAVLASLPSKCSRHNTPSQSHAVTKLLKNSVAGDQLDVVLICERRDVFATACAVARAYPLFSRKTSSLGVDSVAANETQVRVEYVLVGGGGEKTSLAKADFECLDEIAECVQLAARIVDTPCSEMNTMHFLKEIEKVADATKAKLTVIKGDELRDKGFGGIYSVGRAAEVPPVLAVLSHAPPGASTTIAWVGKGIVYDTGGLSIKSKTGMPGMKRDCGGAAAVLGAFKAAVRRGFTENLHAVFCLAENAVGPRSTKPDDIITLYSGKTVEVNNTDAEGRLVLADGVVYADKVLKADVIVDLATLTGAQGPATGKYHSALITNDEQWEEIAVKAGRVSGDLVHPLPYAPELHFSEFNSAVADMKNSVADRDNAQPSCAALFIASHLGFDNPVTWIHVDMATPVAVGERATGYGVGLLNVMFGKYLKSDLLRSVSPLTEENAANGTKDGETPAKKMRTV